MPYMDTIFLRKKLLHLDNERILKLLTFKHAQNPIFPLAVEEATRRNLDLSEFDLTLAPLEVKPHTPEGLDRWNWAAFLMAPLWTLENKLALKWAVLSWIFPFNLFVMVYLGRNGNRLAFEKSDLTNVRDFLTLQELRLQRWIRAFFIAFVLSMLFGLIGHFL